MAFLCGLNTLEHETHSIGLINVRQYYCVHDDKHVRCAENCVKSLEDTTVTQACNLSPGTSESSEEAKTGTLIIMNIGIKYKNERPIVPILPSLK